MEILLLLQSPTCFLLVSYLFLLLLLPPQVPIDLAFLVIAILSQGAWIFRWSLDASWLGRAMLALMAVNAVVMQVSALGVKEMSTCMHWTSGTGTAVRLRFPACLPAAYHPPVRCRWRCCSPAPTSPGASRSVC